MLVFFTINVTPSLALFNLSQLFYINFFDWFGRFNFFFIGYVCVHLIVLIWIFLVEDLVILVGGGIWQPAVISRLSLYIQMTSSSFVSFSPYIKSAWRIFIFCFYFSFVNLTFFVASFFLPFVNNDLIYWFMCYICYLISCIGFSFMARRIKFVTLNSTNPCINWEN
jgi:hypothetical protein